MTYWAAHNSEPGVLSPKALFQTEGATAPPAGCPALAAVFQDCAFLRPFDKLDLSGI